MTTMELEVKKASLAREILNIDNIEMLNELQKAFNRAKVRLAQTKPNETTSRIKS